MQHQFRSSSRRYDNAGDNLDLFRVSGVGALIFHDCLEFVFCCFYASPYSRFALLHLPAFNLRYAAECQLVAHIPTRLACAFGLRVARVGDCRSMPHMHIAFPIAHCLYAQFSGGLFGFIALGRFSEAGFHMDYRCGLALLPSHGCSMLVGGTLTRSSGGH